MPRYRCVPAEAGVLSGAVAFVLGLAAAMPSAPEWPAASSDRPRSEYAVVDLNWFDAPTFEVGGWLYHRAHFVRVDGVAAYRVSNDRGGWESGFDLVFNHEPSVLLYLVPLAVLSGAGYLLGTWFDVEDVRDAVRCGCLLAIGYGGLAVASRGLLHWTETTTVTRPGGGTTMTVSVSPDPLTTVALIGVLYPVLVGGAGAYLAGTVLPAPPIPRRGALPRPAIGGRSGRPRLRRPFHLDRGVLAGGVLAGVASFAGGVAVAVLVARPSADDAIVELSYGPTVYRTYTRASASSNTGHQLEPATIAGWLFHEAHFAPTEIAVVERFPDLEHSFVMEPPLLLRLVPVVVLLVAGAGLALRANPSSLREAGTYGAHVVAGYLPMAFLSTQFLAATMPLEGESVAFLGPGLLGAVLLTGIAYPVAFGAAGGTLGWLLAGSPEEGEEDDAEVGEQQGGEDVGEESGRK